MTDEPGCLAQLGFFIGSGNSRNSILLLSAEIRFFWRDPDPVSLKGWFEDIAVHGCEAGGGQSRTDLYHRDDDQRELGIKLRGGRRGVEIKGLIETRPPICLGGVFAPVQLWTKWTSFTIAVDPNRTLAITKTRRLRKFSTEEGCRELPLGPDELLLETGVMLPTMGCNVELTRVATADNSIWWTLGLEAFGGLDSVETSLRQTSEVLAGRGLPALGKPLVASYPAWLAALP